jgi:hypothetical protein
MFARKTVRSITDAASDALRRAYLGNKDAYPEAASHLVDLRERLDDWRGRGVEYRDAVRTAYDDAGVQGRDLVRLQNAIRYHVGNELRARLTDDELEDYGLLPRRVSERNRTARSAQSAVLAAAGVGTADNSLRHNLPMILAYVEALLEFAEEQADPPSTLTPDRRVAARLALESISARTARLLKATRGR